MDVLTQPARIVVGLMLGAAAAAPAAGSDADSHHAARRRRRRGRTAVRHPRRGDRRTRPQPPRGLTVVVNGKDVTSRNILDPGVGGERGAGGTGATGAAIVAADRADRADGNTTNFLLRRFSLSAPGPLVIEARTADGATATARLTVEAWAGRGRSASARNVIFLLGDGMGVAHRTAARIVSRGLHNGKAAGRLAMDTLDVTGMVMTRVAQLGDHRFVARDGRRTRPGRRTTTTRKACFPTTPPTRSTTRASSTSARSCGARAAPASTSAS